MQRTTNQWPDNDKSRAIKLFAEQMLELVDDYSWDNYRHHSMSSMSRLIELRRTCMDIRKNRLPRAAIEPMLEELCACLRDDAVMAHVGFDVETFIGMLTAQGASTDDLVRNVNTALDRMAPLYKTACEAEIVNCLLEPKAKKDLIRATKYYCSFIIWVGYHRKFIFDAIMKIFFSSDHQKIGIPIIRQFFAIFSRKEHSFDVIGKSDRHFSNALKLARIAELLPATKIPIAYAPSAPELFILGTGASLFEIKQVKALDEYGAYAFAESLLNAARAMILNVPSSLTPVWGAGLYIVQRPATQGAIVFPPLRPLDRKKKWQPRGALKSVKRYSRQLLDSFERSSAERFLRSLNTSALARTSPNLETQLISLWSAIEVLLSEPPSGVPRIRHYVELLLPALCIGYVRSTLIHCYEDLLEIYGRDLTEIIQRESIGADPHAKFATTIMATNRKDAQDAILALCASSPLALHRLYVLHSSLNSPKQVFKYLKRHEDRVRWQLHRIYRVRNDLVHSGRNAYFLEPVLGNLDEYFRIVSSTVIRASRSRSKMVNLDQIINDVCFDYKMYVTRLSQAKDNPIQAEDALKFIFQY